jgi:hypothetical protein
VTERFYWRARLRKDGADIGVMTWYGAPVIDGEEQDRSHRWQALVRGETTSRAILMGEPCPIEVDGISLRNIKGITEADYRLLIDHAAYAVAHRPDLPDASPNKAIDWNRQKPPF